MAVVLDQGYIERNKLDKVGHLINREQNLIFTTNSQGEILFQKTNCEGSEKPSVMQMWGSCFSTINALKRDISKHRENNNSSFYYIEKADTESSNRQLEGADSITIRL